MTLPEHRTNERPSYYTMKTPAPVPAMSPRGLTHTRSSSQPCINSKTVTSPMPSPRAPHSVSRAHSPKLSPGVTRPVAHDARTPSPNYFGLAVDSSEDPRDSCMVPRENWSSPSSSVKSFAAAIPKQLPLDANPEFEAFRRQVDANRARAAFSLSTSHFSITTGSVHTPSALQRPRPQKLHSQGTDGSDSPFPRASRLRTGPFGLVDVPAGKVNRDAESQQEDSAYVSADSKRSSAVSLTPPYPLFTGTHDTSPPEPQPPSPIPYREEARAAIPRADGAPSPQLPAPGKVEPPPKESLKPMRADAVPQAPATASAAGPTLISPAELKSLLEKDQGASVLLLDLRISPQFSQARIRGALNLCIPTTLLKRTGFNLQKLQQTFHSDQDQKRFSDWRDANHLVVYDASSSDKRDAVSAVNMIRKFTNEGYSGHATILHGGFNAFAAEYPSLLDCSAAGVAPGLSLGGNSISNGLRPSLPPVIGGVLLPNANDSPIPFFDNIRQNQDLVDGVGQIDVGVPSGLARASLPRWLREASEASDHGKRVSDKFFRIELREQSRMRQAYSVVDSVGVGKAAHEKAPRVQLSGIEQGGKNRYKDILPFEHARVRLLGRPEGACDYVNASHLQAKRSYKRYIASQGPLPATFEDFWSVVWDNDVRVIVMLTAESEGGQLKCHPYWKGKDFGPIRLRVLSEKKVSLDINQRRSPANTSTATTAIPTAVATTDDSTSSTQFSASDPPLPERARRRANTTMTLDSGPQISNQFNFMSQASAGVAETPYVIIRKFALSHTAHPFLPIREITQFHYPSWPDFGTPAQPSHLLALVELANVMQHAAPPFDVPGTLVSAPASQHNSDTAVSGLEGPLFGRPRADRGSFLDPKRADLSPTPLIWHDGPESSDHARPMLVHCSAGCGRTGAFCTVDSVIDMLKRQRQHVLGQSPSGATNGQPGRGGRSGTRDRDSDGDITMTEGAGGTSDSTAGERGSNMDENGDMPSIDTSWLDDGSIDLVAQTVEDFRGQRLSMVQSLRQFVLCYETVLEWVRRVQESGGKGLDTKRRGRSESLAF